MPSYDVLEYRDFTDNRNDALIVGDDAGAKIGDTFTGQRVVAVGPPIHEGKAQTVVLAHSDRPMKGLQGLVDRLGD